MEINQEYSLNSHSFTNSDNSEEPDQNNYN